MTIILRIFDKNFERLQWGEKVQTCVAGEEWVDFMDASVDKGNALRILQDYFGVSREETMAFGDNTNDIGLMKAAGFSYAVENARPEVKEAARFICPSYLEKGVWKVISEKCGPSGSEDEKRSAGI